LDGTIAAFLEERIKKTETKITDRKTKRIGFVVNGLSPKTGGNSKSAVLGGLKPSSAANHTPT
jgi:hypothetical protein